MGATRARCYIIQYADNESRIFQQKIKNIFLQAKAFPLLETNFISHVGVLYGAMVKHHSPKIFILALRFHPNDELIKTHILSSLLLDSFYE